jgi:hypothetical protein
MEITQSPDVFLEKFLHIYKTNPEFSGSLICGLLRAASVAKFSSTTTAKKCSKRL